LKKLSAIIALLTISFNLLQAQIYNPGYVITNTGDTLRGVLESRENTFNPVSVNFKSTSEDKAPIKYDISQIKQVTYSNGESFERHWVSITMDYIDLQRATDRKVEITFDTVFLRVIQKGKVLAFYSYEDKIKKRYYILQSEGTRPLELGYKVEKDGPKYLYRYQFRETLLMIAESSHRDISRLINKTEYRKEPLLKVISEINDLTPEINLPLNREARGLRFGAGIRLAGIKYQGENKLSENVSATTQPGFWIMAAYDLPKKPSVAKLIFRGELFFSTAKVESKTFDNTFISTKVSVDHDFSQRNFGVGAAVLYNLVNKSGIKIYTGLGFRGNYSSYNYTFIVYRTSDSGVSVTEDDSGEPRKLWTSIPIRAGLIKRKFEFSVLYTPGRKMNNYDAFYAYKMSFLEAGIVYHLNR
jgi:hypothetical protein